MVGLRGFKSNLSSVTYLAVVSGLDHLSAPTVVKNVPLSKRPPAETIERLVAEYRTGPTAADLRRRYGIAKTTVLQLIRHAGERVRHPQYSANETAHLIEL